MDGHPLSLSLSMAFVCIIAVDYLEHLYRYRGL